MLEVLPVAFEEGTWQMEDFEWIFEWKSQRFGESNIKWLHENPTDVVEDNLNETVEGYSTVEKIERLRSLKGVQTPMGSALLVFVDPTSYTVIDTNAWDALYQAGHVDEEYPDKPGANDYIFISGCATFSPINSM